MANRLLTLWRKSINSGLSLTKNPETAALSVGDTGALRSDLFSLDQLVRHGKIVAQRHKVGITRGRNSLLRRLNENETILQDFNRSTLIVEKVRQVTPAAEWLLDNFYLIEEQIQIARRHLPRHYSRELPRLTEGPSAKLPRVYDLVLEVIAHLDAQIDIQHLSGFLGAYQTVTTLQLGELWAVPIMLRLGLIENLRRIAGHLAADRIDRDLADTWAQRLEEEVEKDPSRLILVVAEMAKAGVPTSSAFAAEFCKRLSRMNSAVQFARDWLAQRLAEQDYSLEALLLTENQRQAADQVSISHTIGSLRLLGATDWREFVEELSAVHQTLKNDPANVYSKMDFATRDQYRHAVESFARYGRLSENDVAWKAITLAESGVQQAGRQDRKAHVGYYLTDKGSILLEDAAEVHWPAQTLLERSIRRYPLTFYFGVILASLVPAIILIAGHGQTLNIHGWILVWLVCVSGLCISQLSVMLVNWIATSAVKPRRLPRLDYSEGIDPDCQSMVVVPTMLVDSAGIERLLETLEVHYLANPDKNLRFALLTDFRDAKQENLPVDDQLLEQTKAGVEALNVKYQSDRPGIFFLFHRPRRWNVTEGVWMGFERKRGKLAEFNEVLRGKGQERFSLIVGDVSSLARVKYVITLDTDTQLPRDTARELVGSIAHPLNRPEFDAARGIVTEGYSILQPRVNVSLTSATRSWFVRLFAGEAGIDPYTRTVSDVYQDVFNEGSFIGKGIYDVDAFQKALHGRFPENTILSHDLLESVHARSALVSDVELFEDHPSRYNTDVNRRHRWIRGDWQIARWLLPLIPSGDAGRIVNPLSGLSQWKIFDNLRRSLIPVALVAFLLTSWLILPELVGLATLIVCATIFGPALLALAGESLSKPEEWPVSMHLKFMLKSSARQIGQAILTVGFLPYDAFVSADAIVRTCVRLLITRRQLLEWQTASEAERTAHEDLRSFYRAMWISPVLALFVTISLAMTHPTILWSAGPLLALWYLSPFIGWWISEPIVRETPQLTGKQLAFLGMTARRTWRFFEEFVTAQENWLPPDNFQAHPQPTIASRTSPTNMGLALLANLTARDFGYISVGHLVNRTQNTIKTLLRLERYRDHFYNWYDTRTLVPLQPQYISTVDSGNLAGHLLVLSEGLFELGDQKIVTGRIFSGLGDTLNVITSLVGKNAVVDEVKHQLMHPPITLGGVYDLLVKLNQEATRLLSALSSQSAEVIWWLRAFESNCQDHLKDLIWIAPWLTLISESSDETRGRVATKHTHSHDRQSEDETPEPVIGAAGWDWKKVMGREAIPSLKQIVGWAAFLGSDLGIQQVASDLYRGGNQNERLEQLRQSFQMAGQRARERLGVITTLAQESQGLANMDFKFLFDQGRKLFTIGYNVSNHKRDQSFYDLLASEARLSSYVAIVQGQVPPKHWFSLGRLLAASYGEPVLVSWSGSMFEYLMPLLVMPTYENTILDQTCRAAVRAQIQYGKSRGTPWGVSESGYNLTDAQFNYQYRAFGVPGLGFKRGLVEDLVIAPYATAMALMVMPESACENLERLADEGLLGDYGFYEAVDYTASRLPPNETSVILRSFMAHHQGMSLLSLAYLLLNQPMQRRFRAHPGLKAEELLLQERVPKAITTLSSEDLALSESHESVPEGSRAMRIVTEPNSPVPEVHLLSNGRYHVVVSSAGGGYSRWQGLAVTRWHEDPTRDCWGSYCYIRDIESGEFWSAAYQPALNAGKQYEAIFTQARAEFRHRHGPLEVHVEIGVSPEDDVELRRVNITNHSQKTRTIELTTYAEVVLASPAADAAHPAFSNLFVQTEYNHSHPSLLCTRRARSKDEKPPWLVHLMAIRGNQRGEISFETDRSKFIGRGGNLSSPEAMRSSGPLTNTVGSVLDPIVSMRSRVVLAPGETAQVEIIMGITADRKAALALTERYHSLHMADRLFDLAWTHSQVTLRQLDITEANAQLYAKTAAPLIYMDPTWRAQASLLLTNRRGQSALWSYGISGDLPIFLLRVTNEENLDIVKSSIKAHAYWRLKGLAVDLVIINEGPSVYRQSLHDQIVGLISGMETQLLDKPGGIFVRRMEQIPGENRVLLQSVARLIMSDEKGTFEQQLQQKPMREAKVPEFKPTRSPNKAQVVSEPRKDLAFFNGLGGFTNDGREYVIQLPAIGGPALDGQARNLFDNSEPKDKTEKKSMTPAPWVNVIANPRFGTVVTESGGGYTWLENSHEFRLTPWNNDPVRDVSGEAFYIRDEETGQFWSPTPLPARGTTPYTIRHGFGYSVFEHVENEIACEFWIYVAVDAPVKFAVFKLRNLSDRPRKISVTGYWEWVLGELRAKTALHVQTELDSLTGAFVARNPYNTEFEGRVVFVDADEPGTTVTGDRREFLGRNGSMNIPAAMKRTQLSGRTGAALDPCAAMQIKVELPAHGERELSFRLGAAADATECQQLVQKYRQPQAVREALEHVWEYWNRTLGTIYVETPDQATNFLANGWLLYQTLSCRLWARSGFYQSGGAYGFRDQLQDTMALVHAEPGLLREQILRAAAHQFREGDVQHWWHPPVDRGVRTRCSDDFLWLPYATCRYINCVGDAAILQERIPFLDGRKLSPEEESYYDLPGHSNDRGALYEHCVLAIMNGCKFGPHGLPLIGSGDWNDGMNLVGIHGRGESVWLAFFMMDVLTQFAALARNNDDHEFANYCAKQADTLRRNAELHAWDGEWYRRAYFDNGEPLGSRLNNECQIDSIAQSWSVLAPGADIQRSRQAMNSVAERLVRRDAGIIQLFDPPFDKTPLDPGYIKGYVPGVRENGGQYTHGAIWTVMAFAELGEVEKAWNLFSLLNPINHGSTKQKISKYLVEPYVMAADIYAVNPHVGRGGWTWYTGSAGWMYRLVTETLLGIKRQGEELLIQPRLPQAWNSIKVHYRYLETTYHLTITRSSEVLINGTEILENGQRYQTEFIPLLNDHQDHHIEVLFNPIVKKEVLDEVASSGALHHRSIKPVNSQS